jgi:hypothetical protein
MASRNDNRIVFRSFNDKATGSTDLDYCGFGFLECVGGHKREAPWQLLATTVKRVFRALFRLHKASDLKKYINQKSFQPFVIATTDNKCFHINHELNIGVYKRKKFVRVIIAADGVLYVLEPEQICG